MWNLLVLASATEGGRGPSRAGDLFDFALSEIVRVLDVRAGVGTALVPWSADLAPLIAAAVIDTAPSFDPEAEASIGGGLRSGLVPYYPPQAASSEEDSVFYRASHLSLGRAAPLAFAAALQQHPPTHVLVLSAVKEFGALRSFLQTHDASILSFESLTPTAEVAGDLNVDLFRVTNLEERLVLPSEDEDTSRFRELGVEREAELELEPYVAFGLLVQSYFDNILPDDDRRVVRRFE
jgi:hypothetical protein